MFCVTDDDLRSRTQSLEDPANLTDESYRDETYRDENETTYLSAFDVTANSSVWLHTGDTVGPAKICTTNRMIGSESPALGHRRGTFLVDKAMAAKISNKVRVQSTDRRGTYQIAVPQMCPDDSVKASLVDEGNLEDGPDYDGYQKERMVTADCCETDSEERKETNGDSLVDREKIGQRARRKDNRKTFVLNKSKINQEMDSRRGTFVIRKPSDSEKFNAEDADHSGLNDTKENSPWNEVNSSKQKGATFCSSFFTFVLFQRVTVEKSYGSRSIMIRSIECRRYGQVSHCVILSPRLMTMSPFYPCGKPCSRGTHNETVKNPALSPAFDRSNHDRTTAVALFNGHSLERKCDKNHVKQTFNQRSLVSV